MKKILVAVVALALGTAASAQLNIGAKVGLNYTSIGTKIDPEPDEKPDATSGIGFHLGGYLQYNLSDKIGLRPELLYSIRGFKDESSTSSSQTLFGTTIVTETTSEDKGNYSYVEVPLLLAYNVSENFAIHVGPGIGLLMGGKVKSEGETTTTTTTGGSSTTTTSSYSGEASGSDVTEGVRKMELGAVIGLGYQLESGLGFNLRYWRGLNTVNEETDFGGVEVKSNTNLIQFSVSYAFIKD